MRWQFGVKRDDSGEGVFIWMCSISWKHPCDLSRGRVFLWTVPSQHVHLLNCYHYSWFRKPCQYRFFLCCPISNIIYWPVTQTGKPSLGISIWRMNMPLLCPLSPSRPIPSWSHPIHNTIVLTAMFPSNKHPPIIIQYSLLNMCLCMKIHPHQL